MSIELIALLDMVLDFLLILGGGIAMLLILCAGAELQARMMTKEEMDSYIKFHEDFFNL